MTTQTIADLRRALFQTLDGLTNKASPMDIDRARAVAEVAQTIINSAKVEVDHLRVIGGKGSGFIPSEAHAVLPAPAAPPLPDSNNTQIIESRPGVTVRRHTLK